MKIKLLFISFPLFFALFLGSSSLVFAAKCSNADYAAQTKCLNSYTCMYFGWTNGCSQCDLSCSDAGFGAGTATVSEEILTATGNAVIGTVSAAGNTIYQIGDSVYQCGTTVVTLGNGGSASACIQTGVIVGGVVISFTPAAPVGVAILGGVIVAQTVNCAVACRDGGDPVLCQNNCGAALASGGLVVATTVVTTKAVPTSPTIQTGPAVLPPTAIKVVTPQPPLLNGPTPVAPVPQTIIEMVEIQPGNWVPAQSVPAPVAQLPAPMLSPISPTNTTLISTPNTLPGLTSSTGLIVASPKPLIPVNTSQINLAPIKPVLVPSLPLVLPTPKYFGYVTIADGNNRTTGVLVLLESGKISPSQVVGVIDGETLTAGELQDLYYHGLLTSGQSSITPKIVEDLYFNFDPSKFFENSRGGEVGINLVPGKGQYLYGSEQTTDAPMPGMPGYYPPVNEYISDLASGNIPQTVKTPSPFQPPAFVNPQPSGPTSPFNPPIFVNPQQTPPIKY